MTKIGNDDVIKCYAGSDKIKKAILNGNVYCEGILTLEIPSTGVPTSTAVGTYTYPNPTPDLRAWIDSENPLGYTNIVVLNNYSIPGFSTGNLTGLNVKLINNSIISGAYPGEHAITLNSYITIENNGTIRGAGGSGAPGINGQKGADGARGADGADVYIPDQYTEYYDGSKTGTYGQSCGYFTVEKTAWFYTTSDNNFPQIWWNGTYHGLNSLNGPEYVSGVGTVKKGAFVGTGNYECGTQFNRYKVLKKTANGFWIYGGKGGAGGVGGPGGLGGAPGSGNSYYIPKTAGEPGHPAPTDWSGRIGYFGGPPNPNDSRGNWGKQGENGHRGEDGFSGGYGGDWGQRGEDAYDSHGNVRAGNPAGLAINGTRYILNGYTNIGGSIIGSAAY